MKFGLWALCLALMLFPGLVVAQQQKQSLGRAEEITKKHLEKVLQRFPQYEGYGEEIGKEIVKDGKAGNVMGQEAAKEHPWAMAGNMNSELDYYLDSFFNLDARPENATNWSQAWSCFEPKLLAKAKNGRTVVDVAGPDNGDLVAECRSKCINHVEQIPYERGSIIGAIMYRALGCGADPDPWGYLENGYEVVEYWFPEYQVSINNYGINRIRPETLSEGGQQFTRKALLAQKLGLPEQQIRQGADESYPMDTSAAKLVEPRQDPFLGQGMSQEHLEDKAYGHVVRTWLSTNMGDRKKNTSAGWEVDPEFSLYDALPRTREQHDAANIWTEYGMFDAITSIPHFSHRIRPDAMKALFGDKSPISEAAKKQKPFWQSQGAAAFRVQRWPDLFKPLQEKFEIQGDSKEVLKEVVYKGGHELFPLVTNVSGFGTPALSAGAVFARRTLYLAGARAPADLGGDESGEVASYFPQGEELGRIATYTINSENKALEIDKLQLISPKRMKDGSRYGGAPPMVSECFRSQNIPNLVNGDADLERWANRNLPSNLVGMYSDRDFFSEQGGDITFTYWNRRIGCFCDRCGAPTGSSAINDGGDGDKLYDKPRKEYCRYPLLPTMTPWSAWAKRDTFAECQRNGKNDKFYEGTGLKDDR